MLFLAIRSITISDTDNTNENPGEIVFDNAQNFDHFKINASRFDRDLYVYFSRSDRENQTWLDADFTIILAGGQEGTRLDFDSRLKIE